MNSSVSAPLPLPEIFPIRPRVILTDVDDTLTHNGRLPVESLAAMTALADQGIPVIPVTGASSGWCDCILRTWPVNTVIGENGAFWLEKDRIGRVNERYVEEAATRLHHMQRLRHLASEVKQCFPEVRLTRDTQYRQCEIAFDIGQDDQISRERVAELRAFCRQHGAEAKVSSIHLNVWFGRYNKAGTVLAWLRRQRIDPDQVVFIGDSSNDESLFAAIRYTVGVANIKDFLPEMKYCPLYVTSQPGGYGFAELADLLLKSA